MAMKMDITACANALKAAMAEHDTAKAENDATERRLSEARNKVNQAQKAFDEAVAEMRKAAPWNTDWHSADRGRLHVA